MSSVIQTIYDIVKAHGGVPIAIGMKVASKEGEGLSAVALAKAGTEFIFSIPVETIYL